MAMTAEHAEGKFAACNVTVASEGFTHIRRSTFHALLSLVKRKELAPKWKRGFKAERRGKVVKLM